VFDVLAVLAQRAGQLVTKEEILDHVWDDRFVSASALTTRIKSARAATGDDGAAQSVIRTLHGKGFMFVAPLR
jgi:DNA-binding winged helix-turn-helix (wHTH) protein